MKRAKILLLGDSISLGYRDIVKCNLRDWCNVVYPKEQGKFAADIYRMLYEWNEYLPLGEDVDFVYWNAGLWDVVRIYEEEFQTSLDIYKSYLYRIVERMRKLFPKAIICFGTTTPVIEKRYTKNFFRCNNDIEVYNDAAYEVLHDKVDLYDDLYTLLSGTPGELYVDATHFGSKTNVKIASHICALINDALKNRKDTYMEFAMPYKKQKHMMLEDICSAKQIPSVIVWGAGNIFRDYHEIIQKYCKIWGIVDKDKRIQGSMLGGFNCISPDEIPSDISLVIVTINSLEAQRDVEDFCLNKGLLCCTYQEYLDVLWNRYENEILENDDVVFENQNPEAKDEMKKYIGLTIPENICNLDCSYCYLSINSNRRYENIGRKNPHEVKYIRRQLRREVLGGACLIGFTGSGETLLADKFSNVCAELLKEGHYLHIVTNGTPTNKIKEVLQEAESYQTHIIFKLSFHYLQLLEKNMLQKFVESVRLIEQSGASYTIELMPHDELIPYIPDVLEFSKKNFGAYPQLTIGRDERDKTKLLTKKSFREFQKIWSVFDSEMFDTRMKLYMTKGRKCGAGPLSFFVDMYSGRVQRCVYYEDLGNIYIDGLENIELTGVRDTCPLEYCYNCHVYAPLGILPLEDVPTYMTIRDRVKEDGTHWIKDDMRRFLDIKL